MQEPKSARLRILSASHATTVIKPAVAASLPTCAEMTFECQLQGSETETLVATARVKSRNSSAIEGKVIWASAKSIWYSSMLFAGLIGGALCLSWGALAIFLFLSALTLCLGHSVGMHRLLIHRSFDAPRWLEHVFVYLGKLVGMAGPMGMFWIHEIRDWQQSQPDCHSFAKHDVGVLRDAFWQMHCHQVLARPPELQVEDRVTGDNFYQWLEATWRWQPQLPLAIALYAVGG
jgi:stearoyl-CoA desaturase (delta-9 desaturase)